MHELRREDLKIREWVCVILTGSTEEVIPRMGAEPRRLGLVEVPEGCAGHRWTVGTWRYAVWKFGMIYYKVVYVYIPRVDCLTRHKSDCRYWVFRC